MLVLPFVISADFSIIDFDRDPVLMHHPQLEAGEEDDGNEINFEDSGFDHYPGDTLLLLCQGRWDLIFFVVVGSATLHLWHAS